MVMMQPRKIDEIGSKPSSRIRSLYSTPQVGSEGEPSSKAHLILIDLLHAEIEEGAMNAN